MSYVAIVDNGHGMTEDVLLEAMRHGGMGPETVRGPHDLGRYGLGLKTATLSQCRRLTVVSVADDKIAAAEWDLDEIESRNEWILRILSTSDALALPHAPALAATPSGTLVLWTKFDRAIAGEASPRKALERLVDESRDHLSLVFHRFLAPDDASKALSLTINGLALQPIDPFLQSNKRTENLPPELLFVEGHPVSVQPYILPHLSNIKEEELRRLGGRDSLRLSQGFYIYRNRRLITAGTWFRMLRHDELSKLARVKVDIPNALDHLWDLDVKKSRANPPEQVRQGLRRIIERIAERSHNVFRERRRRGPGGVVTHLWERQNIRGGISYGINRAHPFVDEAFEGLSREERCHLEQMLKMIEVGLPVDAIYHDMAADRPVELPLDQVTADLKQQLNVLIERVGDDKEARANVLTALPKLDPFSMYPVISRKLIEDMKTC